MKDGWRGQVKGQGERSGGEARGQVLIRVRPTSQLPGRDSSFLWKTREVEKMILCETPAVYPSTAYLLFSPALTVMLGHGTDVSICSTWTLIITIHILEYSMFIHVHILKLD